MSSVAEENSPAPNFSHLLPPSWEEEVQRWIRSDIPKFDIGGFVVGDTVRVAKILGKSPGTLCGKPFVDCIFKFLGCKVTWLREEGDEITEEQAKAKEAVAHVEGPCRNLLMGERTALNLMARASGIASRANRVSKLVRSKGWHGSVAATRKTTPGFSLVEKYAVLVGGATTHRMDLSNMVMLKDNHVWSTGSIAESVKKAKIAAGHATKVEVECRNLEEAYEAAGAGAEIVMLDNFGPEKLKQDAAIFKEKYPHVIVEASGGITIDTICSYISPHVDVVSQGSLTQGYAAVDFSMKLPRPEGM
jgi:nicotinate-nucleotide pyrophosphorylase (carboxylating)